MRVRTSHGFSAFPLVMFLGIVAIALGYVLYGNYKKMESNADRPEAVRVETRVVEVERQVPAPEVPVAPAVSWMFDGEKWKASAPPVACPAPLVLGSPVNVDLATKVLYPGQYRNDNYKPHGGFIFDGKKNTDIAVTAPLDARLVLGSRYIEEGEVQYMLWFENPCGIAYRFDHLLTLSPSLKKLADSLPEPKLNDSRTTRFAEPLAIKAGEVIATSVGFEKINRVFVDFGVYDLRNANAPSQNKDFALKHKMEKEQAYYGVCWFDLFPAEVSRKVRALPPGSEGATSDYCKPLDK